MRCASVLQILLLLVFGGCQETKTSSFDSWQPPPPSPQPSKVIIAETDEVTPKSSPNPKIKFSMPVATTDTEKMIEPRVERIVISLASQRLYAYGGDETPLAVFKCSTAVGGLINPLDVHSGPPHNHIGNFVIDRKDIDHVSGEFGCPMPYALHYHAGHWIHATEPKFYSKLGTPASHGCVRLRGSGSKKPNDAAWLYSHTAVGCQVEIS